LGVAPALQIQIAGLAYAHMAGAAPRRAERAAAGAAEINLVLLRYLNRLSDHPFVLGRVLTDHGAGDALWVPGANR
jgi:cob(I)alamin adenosyltransferase